MGLNKLFALFGFVAGAACADDHTPLRFSVAGNDIIASGEIDSESLDLFEETIAANPRITTLVLQDVGGSVDDEANLAFALVVRDMGLTTLVPSDGLVASGGTDLFLAGVTRVLERGACVGVHAWAAEDFTATDLPRSDSAHDRYLDYYEEIEIDPEFYWFTLDAAPADAMHWMTSAEAARFGVSTNQVAYLGSPEGCDSR